MLHDAPHFAPRQLLNPFTTSASSTTPHCTPFTLPSSGIIQLDATSAITLTTNVVFQPECTGVDSGDVFPVGYLKDPFYASTIPTVYVIASATVIAWILVVMLVITPRTSFFGIPTTAGAFSNGHGIIGGANGGGLYGLSGSSSRPWLQKMATLFVAIALTIATADTLEVAERQYFDGIMDADKLRKEVMGSMEIRITRLVSDIFVWLAQVQTLIRLFPRHKEKVLIKWIGFLLIALDTIFSCLNSFMPGILNPQKGQLFVDAIPALSYLFELALGLLYAAWVLYFTMTKRRYAYYHAKMRSISLIALLSLVSILTPVVFFVTDVSNPAIAGWGDYFRWVGAAAASVVVWEWVERIEALERDDKRDGVLGREIFDGDEMLDTMPSDGAPWSQSRNVRRNFRRHGHDGNLGGGNASGMVEHGLSGVANRFRSRHQHQQSPQHFPLGRAHSSSEPVSSTEQGNSEERTGRVTFGEQPRVSHQQDRAAVGGPTPPIPVASPVSQADTTSAASTVYVVRYDQTPDVPQPIRRRRMNRNRNWQDRLRGENAVPGAVKFQSDEKDPADVEDDAQPNRNRDSGRWRSVPNPFKRKRTSPPQEVQRAKAAASEAQNTSTPAHATPRWDVKNRLGALTSETAVGLRDWSGAGGRNHHVDSSVTIIPAQPRGSGRAWSPANHAVRSQSTLRNAHHDPRSSVPPASQTTVGMEDHSSRTAPLSAVPEVGLPPQQERQDHQQQQQHQQHDVIDYATPNTTPAPHPPVRDAPPRADDISPPSGVPGLTVVVPAPQRRSPKLHDHTPPPPRRNGTSSPGSSGAAPAPISGAGSPSG